MTGSGDRRGGGAGVLPEQGRRGLDFRTLIHELDIAGRLDPGDTNACPSGLVVTCDAEDAEVLDAGGSSGAFSLATAGSYGVTCSSGAGSSIGRLAITVTNA